MSATLTRIFNIKWPLDEKSAKTCMIINLAAWPGLGSTMGKRKAGWVQMVLSLVGLLMFAAGLERFMSMIWQETRYPKWSDHFVWYALGGVALFIISWIWSLFTGISMVSAAKQPRQPPALPPNLPPQRQHPF